MAGWHHRCNERALEQTSGDGEGQRGLVCCTPWGLNAPDSTGRLNSSNRVSLLKPVSTRY